MKYVAGVLIAVAVIGGAFYLKKKLDTYIEAPVVAMKEAVANQEATAFSTPVEATGTLETVKAEAQSPAKSAGGSLSYSDLLALADNKYADGNVPLGDYRYTTDAPKKGYIYLCNARQDNPGSMVNGSWINGDTWNFLKKISVSGSVSWPNAAFSNVISAGMRVLTGNALPINHTTGVFPVAANDPAAKIDPNPSTISAQTLKQSIPADPVYSDTPYCMTGEVGIMLTGVPLFNGFDAGLRDAAAHELQDSCDGHPQGDGQYHYHSMSKCFKGVSVTTVLGYAYDGFPITGPLVAKDEYLTTEDLDICHGITSEIVIDGVKKTTYHYVMTQDFPYSASCYRGKSYMTRPAGAGQQNQQQMQQGGQQSGQTPPQEAISACSGKTTNTSCSFKGGRGETVSGTCRMTPSSSLACTPNR
ncbi:MAG TPA: YHYH protein [Candidatus Paceibacterota bacterium]